MSGHVPHHFGQRLTLALIAVTSLAGLTSATAALAQQPDPAPLWKAYPLSPRSSTGTTAAEHPTGAPLQIQAAPRPRASAAGGAQSATAPLIVAIAFYGALTSICAIAVGAATVHVMRRRAAQPITCEISWSPSADGDAFRATALLDGEHEWVVAQSGRFERRSPDPPEYDTASHAAYDQLLRDLYADGWLPYERGREWWAMRLRRTAGSPTPTPTPTRDG